MTTLRYAGLIAIALSACRTIEVDPASAEQAGEAAEMHGHMHGLADGGATDADRMAGGADEPSPGAVDSSAPHAVIDLAHGEGFSRAGRYFLRWRSTPAPIPVNEPFELDVWILDGADPSREVEGAKLYVRGWMPDHGHGMIRRPKSKELEAGHLRVHGMLLHMTGRWSLHFDVLEGQRSETVDFELELL